MALKIRVDHSKSVSCCSKSVVGVSAIPVFLQNSPFLGDLFSGRVLRKMGSGYEPSARSQKKIGTSFTDLPPQGAAPVILGKRSADSQGVASTSTGKNHVGRARFGKIVAAHGEKRPPAPPKLSGWVGGQPPAVFPGGGCGSLFPWTGLAARLSKTTTKKTKRWPRTLSTLVVPAPGPLLIFVCFFSWGSHRQGFIPSRGKPARGPSFPLRIPPREDVGGGILLRFPLPRAFALVRFFPKIFGPVRGWFPACLHPPLLVV